jgi:hypothetical protein
MAATRPLRHTAGWGVQNAGVQGGILNSAQLMSGMDFQFGGFAASVFLGVAAAAAMVALGTYGLRRAGPVGSVLWAGALVTVGALISLLVSDRSFGDFGAERRAIETRAAELSTRAIAPGSPLACLDAIANAEVETACERALFASPETVAVALTYVDARLSLLASSASLADRDSSYRPPLERMRRAIEDDHFGLAAQVLTTRGCTPARCADFAVLRNTARIVANMQSRSFDIRVGLHAAAWHSSGGAMAAAATPGTGPALASVPITTSPAPLLAPGALPKGIDFPSAASIPPVSIMNSEPGGEVAEPRAAQTPPTPKRPPPAPRRQTQRDTPAPPAAPPLSVVPQTSAPAQTSGSR